MNVPERLAQLAGPHQAAAVMRGQFGFERLEWLGDSIQDVLVSRHLCLSRPEAVSVQELGVLHSSLVSDRAAMRVATRFALPQVQSAEHPTRPEDKDPRHRQGDSVEAWVGAAWSTGGWRAAAEAVTLLVLTGCDVDQLLVRAGCPVASLADPQKQLAMAAAKLGWEPGDARWLALVVAPVPFRRRLVLAGAASLELAAARQLYEAHPKEDEGQLSRRRASMLAGTRLTNRAGRALPALPGFPANDRLLLAIAGAALLDAGPGNGTKVAARLLES